MDERSLVLALSKNERNLQLLADLVDEEGCETHVASTVEEFDAVLRLRDDVAVAVLDAEGFAENLWERCESLDTRDASTVVLTAATPARLRREAISRGVRSILEKLVERADLRATIRGMLREE